jgi:sugar transferase (PEP-CTERM/EpsH1 system associated)
MEPILFLAHRIPYPPDKGDKVRSHHLLRYLCARYRVFLGTFYDDPADAAHVASLERLCAGVCALRLRRGRAKVRSLVGLATGEALTLPYYRDRRLARWVDRTIVQHAIRKAVVFSSAMAQYVEARGDLRVVVDFVDVDSDKWTQYAATRPWPLAAIYRREGRRLAAFERRVAAAAHASFFVSARETEFFVARAPEASARVSVLRNGVDADYFSPAHALDSPFAAGEEPLVFTGAMDYWPNVDAVTWFAREILPEIRAALPAARFYVVGMNPTAAVQALARLDGVVVTGRVDDVRPYLRHAAVVVAPLRIQRGVQNKVLEAMAMGRAVVASAVCAGAIAARPGAEFEVATSAEDFAEKVLALLASDRRDALGRAARARVLTQYDWNANLERLGPLLAGPTPGGDPRPQPARAAVAGAA